MDIRMVYNIIVSKCGFKKREEQLDMAQTVNKTLSQGGLSFIESPTGTGKTLAYIIGACQYCIEKGDRSVVIATPHIQLQKQMLDEFDKIKEYIPEYKNIKIAVLKGRYNYLSLERIRRQEELAQKQTDKHKRLMSELRSMADSFSGDYIAFPEAFILDLREHGIDIEDLCIKPSDKSPDHLHYYELAKQEAANANVVIANHFALAWHRRLKKEDAPFSNTSIIIDEAHDLPTNIELASTDSLAFNTIRWAVKNLILALHKDKRKKIRRTLISDDIFKRLQAAYTSINKIISSVRKEALANSIDIMELREPAGYSKLEKDKRKICKSVFDMQNHFHDVMDIVAPLSKDSKLKTLIEDLGDVKKTLDSIIASFSFSDEENNQNNYFCYFLGFSPVRRYPSLHRVNPDKYPFLSRLWPGFKSIILTSGTLSDYNKKDFSIIENILMMKVFANDVGIHSKKFYKGFDFRDKINTFIYPEVPEYNHNNPDDFLENAVEILEDVVEHSKGSVLILSPAHVEAKKIYDMLKDTCSEKILYFGPEPKKSKMKYRKTDIIKEFEKGNRVLVSASFWVGVDLKGLTDLVIMRIPNPNPNSPMQKARTKYFLKIYRNRKSALGFMHFHRMFETIIRFKQGCGRIGRNEDDMGNIYILDSRILNKDYKGFLRFLEERYNVIIDYPQDLKVKEG